MYAPPIISIPASKTAQPNTLVERDVSGNIYACCYYGDGSHLTGVSGGGLQPTNNLCDLCCASDARSNLGLGSAAVCDASCFDAAGSYQNFAGAVLACQITDQCNLAAGTASNISGWPYACFYTDGNNITTLTNTQGEGISIVADYCLTLAANQNITASNPFYAEMGIQVDGNYDLCINQYNLLVGATLYCLNNSFGGYSPSCFAPSDITQVCSSLCLSSGNSAYLSYNGTQLAADCATQNWGLYGSCFWNISTDGCATFSQIYGPVNTSACAGSIFYSSTGVLTGDTVATTDGCGNLTLLGVTTTPQSLSDSSGTIAWDAALGQMGYVTLSGTGRTLTISNGTAGSTLMLKITQGSGGSKTITTWTNVKWIGGVVPTLSTAAASVDILTLTTWDGTNFYGVMANGMA